MGLDQRRGRGGRGVSIGNEKAARSFTANEDPAVKMRSRRERTRVTARIAQFRCRNATRKAYNWENQKLAGCGHVMERMWTIKKQKMRAFVLASDEA